MRYEQTYNVVNLENKLKGLEDKPGYPAEKQPNFTKKDGGTSKTDYNIISNLNLREHGHLPEELRPKPDSQEPKKKKIFAAEYRDYNIISGKYLSNHEERVKLDLEYAKLEAAKKYWETHDYDPIKVTYIDPEKETQFVQENEEMAKTHGLDKIEKLPQSIKYSESALYQPINMRVVDADRLYEIDMKNKLAKQRYEMRYDIEKEYRLRDLEESERNKIQTVNRINHQRYIETRERGYNIISHAPFEGKYAEKLYDPATKPAQTLWDKTMSLSAVGEFRSQSASSPHTNSKPPSQPERISFINNGKSEPFRDVPTPKPRTLRSSGFRTVHANV